MPIRTLQDLTTAEAEKLQKIVAAINGQGSANAEEIRFFVSRFCNASKVVMTMSFEPDQSSETGWKVEYRMTLMLPDKNGTFREQVIQVPNEFGKDFFHSLIASNQPAQLLGFSKR